MAYTNFSSSNWFTFWSSAFSKPKRFKLPTKKLKYGQVLEIKDQLNTYYVKYGDLINDGLGNILDRIRAQSSNNYPGSPFRNPTAAELHQLIDVLDKFEKDINEHFRFWTFIRYEWWLPAKNKVKFWLHK